MYKKIMIGLFALMLLLLPILSLILMPKEAQPFSENENRYLTAFPALSVNSLKDGKFTSDFESWASDRFIDREDWIIAKNNTEKLLGKTEINGVFTSSDKMIEAWKGYDKSTVEASLKAINAFSEMWPDTPVYFMLAPTTQEIYSELIPANADVPSQKSFIKYCYDSLTNVTGIDIYSTLLANKNNYIYYRTDHHWTSLGAYLAYSAAAGKMGYTATDISSYTIEHASSDFRGTLYSKTLDSTVTPDLIDIYALTENEPKLRMTIVTGKKDIESESLYFREYLTKKDKYSTYLGTNAPIITINTELENNDKSLLIFKDSYAHCLIPFLTKNYSKITIMDMRYFNSDYRSVIDVSDYDQVLFMYNVITFSEDTHIRKLNVVK